MVLIELTVPAEENFKSSRDYKLTKYKGLVNDLCSALPGWAIELACVEVGARGLHQDTLTKALGASVRLDLMIKPPSRVGKIKSAIFDFLKNRIWIDILQGQKCHQDVMRVEEILKIVSGLIA